MLRIVGNFANSKIVCFYHPFLIMKKSILFVLLAAMAIGAEAQTVTFTGHDQAGRHLQLDRVVVTNLSKGWQQTLVWPDTVLTLSATTPKLQSSGSQQSESLKSLSVRPNPFNGNAEVYIVVKDAGVVSMTISNMGGRTMAQYAAQLDAGTHLMRVSLKSSGTYVMSVKQNGKTTSTKLLCNAGGASDKIEYQGVVKAPFIEPITPQTFIRDYADEMEYIGYTLVDGMEVESGRIHQVQQISQTVTLLFNTSRKVTAKSPAAVTVGDFRVALSLSPFSLNQFDSSYTFVVNGETATTPEELQTIYNSLGSTEMYVRIATKRHKTAENTVDGEPDENANVHTFDQALRLCRIAASLNVPINPEIMCAYTYMDMDRIQAPRFDEYPEFNGLMNSKAWSELSLDEVCSVLEAYGEFVADSILATGCTVKNWNLGNEANFGFAGIGMGAKSAVNPKLAKAGALKRYTASLFSLGWLKRNVWKYNAQEYAAVKRGVLKAYAKLGIDASDVKFSTHIATVVFTPRCSAAFFKYMAKHGYEMETAGISYYPSAPAMSFNKKKLLKKTISRINRKCEIPVFIGEFSYPSGKMEGPFASWNKKLKGYNKDQQGQANLYRDVIAWGKENGMAGIRYWAPDYKGWYSMSMFEFNGKTGTAKTILKNHKEISGQ